MSDADDEEDRLMKLLDVAINAVRQDDEVGALMALEAGLKSARNLPQKPQVFYLPDQSRKD